MWVCAHVCVYIGCVRVCACLHSGVCMGVWVQGSSCMRVRV